MPPNIIHQGNFLHLVEKADVKDVVIFQFGRRIIKHRLEYLPSGCWLESEKDSNASLFIYAYASLNKLKIYGSGLYTTHNMFSEAHQARFVTWVRETFVRDLSCDRICSDSWPECDLETQRVLLGRVFRFCQFMNNRSQNTQRLKTALTRAKEEQIYRQANRS